LRDGEPLDGSDVVIRRLSHQGPSMIATDRITGARRPSSGAFKPDEDGVSVYSQAAMTDRNLTVHDLRTGDANVFVALAVSAIRDVTDLDVVGAPWPSYADSHRRNAAHALIVGWGSLTKKQRKERQDQLVQMAAFM
jgi:hypothetical protein